MTLMHTLITTVLASTPVVPSVPDSGTSGILFGFAILAVGVIGRLLKNRRK